MIEGFTALYIFMLSAFTGYEVISRVPVILHTPMILERKGRNALIGVVATHLGILILIAGAIYGLSSGFRHEIRAIEGEMTVINYAGEKVRFEIFIADPGNAPDAIPLPHVCLEVKAIDGLVEKCRTMGFEVINMVSSPSAKMAIFCGQKHLAVQWTIRV